MAGLGETCTHIAAVLFYLEALYRIKEAQTCTQQQCDWITDPLYQTVRRIGDVCPAHCFHREAVTLPARYLNQSLDLLCNLVSDLTEFAISSVNSRDISSHTFNKS